MSELPVAIRGDSPEAVAYALLRLVAYGEGKTIHPNDPQLKVDRAWLFSTYRQCLAVVRGQDHDEIPNAPDWLADVAETLAG